MPVAIATLERMDEAITLQKVALKIDGLAEIVSRGFDYAEKKFEAIDRRFDEVDARFAAIDPRFDAIDETFVSIAQQFDAIDKNFAAVNERLDRVEKRMDRLETKMNTIENIIYNLEVQNEHTQAEMRGIHRVIDNLNDRLATVERYLGFEDPALKLF